jgi:hypothetical protein
MCEFCEPYKEKIIDADKGFACVTKKGELVVFFMGYESSAVQIKINYCPMCGRNLHED